MKSRRTSSLLQDIRYTGRLIAGSPGYAAVIVIAVALGVGATSLVFSLVNSVILRPLPYKDAAEIVAIHGVYHEDIDPPTSPPDFLDWQSQNHVFEQIAAFGSTRVNIDGLDHPESVPAAVVSYNLFTLLGVEPIVGQGFKPENDKPGMGEDTLIGYALWQRDFGSDKGIVGKSITLNGLPRTVTGVMPPGLKFPKDEEIWVP
ncbi:MAG TPA: ABC transporter permease, partial [Blastocatellia bacterium]